MANFFLGRGNVPKFFVGRKMPRPHRSSPLLSRAHLVHPLITPLLPTLNISNLSAGWGGRTYMPSWLGLCFVLISFKLVKRVYQSCQNKWRNMSCWSSSRQVLITELDTCMIRCIRDFISKNLPTRHRIRKTEKFIEVIEETSLRSTELRESILLLSVI